MIRNGRLVLATGMALASMLWGQAAWGQGAGGQNGGAQFMGNDAPDATHTRVLMYNLLNRYPPTVQTVLSLDPGLLTNQAYLASYPALAAFLGAHPEVVRNPSFYIGGPQRAYTSNQVQESPSPAAEVWRQLLSGLAGFLAFGMGIGLIVWLIRTSIDYRRWNRLAQVQADTHTKILDRFTSNEELLAYIQSPAGRRFLESTPIMLDEGPRSVGAPLGRILWSIQAGLVLGALGVGLELMSRQFSGDAAQPLRVLGPVGIALGIGFLLSAGASFAISRRLGLIEGLKEPPAEQ